MAVSAPCDQLALHRPWRRRHFVALLVLGTTGVLSLNVGVARCWLAARSPPKGQGNGCAGGAADAAALLNRRAAATGPFVAVVATTADVRPAEAKDPLETIQEDPKMLESVRGDPKENFMRAAADLKSLSAKLDDGDLAGVLKALGKQSDILYVLNLTMPYLTRLKGTQEADMLMTNFFTNMSEFTMVAFSNKAANTNMPRIKRTFNRLLDCMDTYKISIGIPA